MIDEEERKLMEQEDAILEAGLKGMALFVLAALVILAVGLFINYVGF